MKMGGFFSVEVQARFSTKTEENTATSSDSQVLSAVSPIRSEPSSVHDPVMSRVTSIILQPPAVAPTHSVSTPIFTHLGQQVHKMIAQHICVDCGCYMEHGIGYMRDQYKTPGKISVHAI